MKPDDIELSQHPKTAYKGTVSENEILEIMEKRVDVSIPGDKNYILPLRTDIEGITDHIYEWGYGGTGPHLLSVSILWDAYKNENTAKHYMGPFVDDYISRLDGIKDWEVTAEEIHDMLTDDDDSGGKRPTTITR